MYITKTHTYINTHTKHMYIYTYVQGGKHPVDPVLLPLEAEEVVAHVHAGGGPEGDDLPEDLFRVVCGDSHICWGYVRQDVCVCRWWGVSKYMRFVA